MAESAERNGGQRFQSLEFILPLQAGLFELIGGLRSSLGFLARRDGERPIPFFSSGHQWPEGEEVAWLSTLGCLAVTGLAALERPLATSRHYPSEMIDGGFATKTLGTPRLTPR